MLWAFGTVLVDDGECQLVHKSFFLKEVHKSTPEVEMVDHCPHSSDVTPAWTRGKA